MIFDDLLQIAQKEDRRGVNEEGPVDIEDLEAELDPLMDRNLAIFDNYLQVAQGWDQEGRSNETLWDAEDLETCLDLLMDQNSNGIFQSFLRIQMVSEKQY